MNSNPFAFLILATTLASPTFPQERPANEAEHRLGQHPAVIIKERWKTQGYDYASKFYPHPAWLFLLPEAPGSTMESPSELAARQQERDATERPAPPAVAKARN